MGSVYIKWHLACKDNDHLIDVWFFIDLDSFDLKGVEIEALVCVLVIIRVCQVTEVIMGI